VARRLRPALTDDGRALDLLVDDLKTEEVVDLIVQAPRTGHIGDGKIFNLARRGGDPHSDGERGASAV